MSQWNQFNSRQKRKKRNQEQMGEVEHKQITDLNITVNNEIKYEGSKYTQLKGRDC